MRRQKVKDVVTDTEVTAELRGAWSIHGKEQLKAEQK